VHMYMHACISVRIYVCRIFVCIYVCMHICMQVFVYVCIMSMDAFPSGHHAQVRVYTYAYLFVRVYICAYVGMPHRLLYIEK